MKIALVLRSGGDYDVSDVQWLANQLPGEYEIVCFTDYQHARVHGVTFIPFMHNWHGCRGWWAKLELFRPDVEDDLFYMDLDTVITGDIRPILENLPPDFTMLRDSFYPQYLMSSVMWIPNKDKEQIWSAFFTDRVGWINRCVTTECWGDQGFIRKVMGAHTPVFNDICPGWFKSYKADIAKPGSRYAIPRYSRGNGSLPEDCRVVIFHGTPRPRRVQEVWIPGSQGYTGHCCKDQQTDGLCR